MRRLMVLHVEDNKEEAELLVRACRAAELPVDFQTIGSADEAIAYLNNAAEAVGIRMPVPDLIILELHLEGMDGFKFLRWLRHESGFRTLPVLVFTRSRDPKDKTQATADGATACFSKPADFESYVKLAESIIHRFPDLNNGRTD